MFIINFTMRKPNRYNLNQIVKINITTNGANQHCMPPNRCTERAPHYFYGSPAKNHKPRGKSCTAKLGDSLQSN